ncbi:DUF4214 domain-containing protein [Luminiphilus sp.]|nr:DUF4214 domain-containing protein [Luminiphilus sp.]
MGMNTAAVQRLYVAYFNRPADPISLAVYEGELSSTAVATQAELQALAEKYFSPSTEYTTNFSGLSNSQIVDKLYQNIFGRPAEAAGLISWATALTDGSETVASIALQLSYSAQGTDADTVNNRITAATSFTNGLDTAAEITGYSGDAAAASAKTWLATVTDDASLTTALAGVDQAIADAVAIGNADPVKSFVLTTGVDTFTGGNANDTFTADNTGAAETTSTADTLDGGDGTGDTLTIFSDGTIGAAPATSNIEILNVYDEDSNFSSLTSYAGVNTMNFFRGDGAINYTVADAVTTIGLSDTTLAATGSTFTYGATTTAATLNLSNVANGGNTDDDLIVAGTKLTDLTVNVTTASGSDELRLGAVTSLTLNTDAAFAPTLLTTTGTKATLTLTGAGKFTAGVLDNDFTTVAGAGHSGSIIMTAPANSADASITLGTGADTFTTDDDGFTALQTFAVNAGDGEDILVAAADADVDTADEAGRYTGFDVISRALNSDLSMTPFGASTTIDKASLGDGGLTNMQAALAGSIALVADNAGSTFSLATATGKADVLSIASAHTTATASADLTTVTVDGFETLNFAANSGDATLAATADRTSVSFTSASTLTTVNLSGSKSVNLDASSNAVLLSTINAADVTGGAIIATGAVTQALTVTGSGVVDQITVNTVGAGGSATVNAGAGKDSILATVANATAATINGGADADTLVLSDAPAGDASLIIADAMFNDMDVETVDFSGAIAGDLTFTVGGFADSMATRNGNVLGITSDTTATLSAADDITIDASAMSAGNSVSVSITNTAAAATKVSNITVTGSDGNDVITLEEDKAASANLITANGGAGDDTITIKSSSTHDGAIVVSSGAGNDTIDLTAATTDAAVTANLVTPGSGNDIIKLDADAANTKVTIVTGSTAALTGELTITNFTQGATADVLKPDAFLNATAMNAALTANPGAPGDVENDVNLLVDIAGGEDITTAAGLTAALGTGGEYANVNMAASGKAVFVTAATNNAAETQYLFFATSDAGGNITAVSVGTIGSVDIDDFNAANFAI